MITDDELIVKSKTILKELGIEINILEKKIDKINYYMTNNKKSDFFNFWYLKMCFHQF